MTPEYSFAACCIGLIAANYTFQFFTKREWKKAFERSYFQMIALFCYVALFA